MLDVGLSELALIAIVALVVLGPKDMMHGMKYVLSMVKNLRNAATMAREQVHSAMDEIGLDDLAAQTRTIIDLDGKPQIAYDVSELESLAAPKAEAPPHEPS
jgi:sec-independent protein translocase protein TatB